MKRARAARDADRRRSGGGSPSRDVRFARGAALGPLTALVNSASVFEDDGIATMTRASWDKHIETNLRAPLVLSQAFAKQLPAGAEGAIVNIIDQAVLNLTPQFLSYTVSKAGLWTLTQTLAQALAPRIRVNAVAPGPSLKAARQSSANFEAQVQATLLKRPSEPADIAAAVHYLLTARCGNRADDRGRQRAAFGVGERRSIRIARTR